MDLDTFAQFLLLGFSCCSCNSGCGYLSRGKMQNQLLQPWERGFLIVLQIRGSQPHDSATENTAKQRCHQKPLPCCRGWNIWGHQDAVPKKEVWHQARWGDKSNFILSQGDPQEGEGKSGQIGLTPLSWEILSGDWKENLTSQVTAYCQEMEGSLGETPDHRPVEESGASLAEKAD